MLPLPLVISLLTSAIQAFMHYEKNDDNDQIIQKMEEIIELISKKNESKDCK